VCSALVVKLLPYPKGDGRGKSQRPSKQSAPKKYIRPDLARVQKPSVKAVIKALTNAGISCM
jgi:hypothetical protein